MCTAALMGGWMRARFSGQSVRWLGWWEVDEGLQDWVSGFLFGIHLKIQLHDQFQFPEVNFRTINFRTINFRTINFQTINSRTINFRTINFRTINFRTINIKPLS